MLRATRFTAAHPDPFDRMIAAQAIDLLSADPRICVSPLLFALTLAGVTVELTPPRPFTRLTLHAQLNQVHKVSCDRSQDLTPDSRKTRSLLTPPRPDRRANCWPIYRQAISKLSVTPT